MTKVKHQSGYFMTPFNNRDRWKRIAITNGIIFIFLVDALISFILEYEKNGFNLGKIVI